MTARKIVKLGKETFVVSLPSAWVRHYKLKKGDELDVQEEGPKLVVSPQNKKEAGRVVVDVSGTEPVTKRIVGALYKVGYDEFEVKFSTNEELSSIKRVMEELVGFEMIKESKNSVVIKNVSNIVPDEFGNIQRKMFFVIATMAKDCLSESEKENWKKLEFLAGMDADVNKYADFCRRILNTIGHKVTKRAPPSYYIVEQLERIGDSFRDICRYVGSNKVKISKDLADIYREVISFLMEFNKVYSNFSLEGMAVFAKTHYKLVKKFESLSKKVKKEELQIIELLNIVEADIFDMNGAVMAENL
jgi:phosphate uptake regulator